MSDAYKCGRCGGFDDGKSPVRIQHESLDGMCAIGRKMTKEDIELCKDCGLKFKEWYGVDGGE